MGRCKKQARPVSRFVATYPAHINKNRHARTEKYSLCRVKRERCGVAYLPSSERCTLCVHDVCAHVRCVCGRLEFFLPVYASSSEKFNYARPHKSYSAARAVGAVHLKTQIIRRQRERESEFWCPVSEWARSSLTTSSISRFSIGLVERQLSQCDTDALLSQFSALHGRLNKYYLCGIEQEETMESASSSGTGRLFFCYEFWGSWRPTCCFLRPGAARIFAASAIWFVCFVN
jgi:hypothetical protein